MVNMVKIVLGSERVRQLSDAKRNLAVAETTVAEAKAKLKLAVDNRDEAYQLVKQAWDALDHAIDA